MNPLDDDKIDGALSDLFKEAHRPDERGAPEFDAMWDEARDGTASGPNWILVAAAAVILLTAVAYLLVPQDEPVRSATEPAQLALPKTSKPLDLEGYAILEWEPTTDTLLERDDYLELPTLGEPTWGEAEWDLESDAFKEL